MRVLLIFAFIINRLIALPDVAERFNQLRAEEQLLDDGFFSGDFKTRVITPSVSLFRAVDHFYDPIYNHTEERIADACSKWPPQNYVDLILEFLKEKGYQKAAFIHYYSSSALSAIEKRLNIQLEELSIVQKLCSNTSDNQFQHESDTIQLLIAEQLAEAMEVFFPESVALVVKQYLNQVSPISYVGNAKEIKNYNQKNANEMLAYLTKFYDGMATFAVGLNRDNRGLIGHLSPNSVIQVTNNGWTSFVYRTNPNIPEFAPFTADDKADFIEALSRIDETTLCVDGNDVNTTAAKVFSIIESVCYDYETLCAIGTFASTAMATTKNCVHSERAMICEHTDFRGFNIFFGMPEQDEPLEHRIQEDVSNENAIDKNIEKGKEEVSTLPYSPGLTQAENNVVRDEKGDEVMLLGSIELAAIRTSRACESHFSSYIMIILIVFLVFFK